MATDGAAYLAEFQVQATLQAAVAQVLRDRPADPVAAISALLEVKGKAVDYLIALKYSRDAANTLLSGKPSVEVLSELVKRHIRTMPFNNLGMHEHPAAGEYPAVPMKTPVLDVATAVDKMIGGLGGFCFEVNFAFSWLLKQLGYTVRLAEGSVMTPGGPVPGHVVLFVDDLDPSGPLLVDPGIGDFSRVVVPMALKTSGGSVVDELGDKYTLVPYTGDAPPWCARFNTVLMKERVAGLMSNPTCEPLGVPDMPVEPSPPQPKYIFASDDDLKYDGPEYSFGIGAVLTVMPENFFSQKKFAVIATDTGFKYLGATYKKEKAHGVEVEGSRVDFDGEAAFRAAADAFGVKL